MSRPSPPPGPGKTWFSQGLRFSCLEGCHRCCGGAPGYVWVTEEEVAKLAAFLNLSEAKLRRDHLRQLPSGAWSVRERRNGDCHFLGPGGCEVYPVRPRQCRDYPFWPEVLATAEAWSREGKRCPGIGSGKLHKSQAIAEMLERQILQEDGWA